MMALLGTSDAHCLLPLNAPPQERAAVSEAPPMHGPEELALAQIDQGGIKNLLVERITRLGGTVGLTPALRLLRRAMPEARIVVCAKPSSASILRGLSSVDEVIEADLHCRGPIGRMRSWMQTRPTRSRGFDLAIGFSSGLRKRAFVRSIPAANRWFPDVVRFEASRLELPVPTVLSVEDRPVDWALIPQDDVRRPTPRHQAARQVHRIRPILLAAGVDTTVPPLEVALDDGDRARVARVLGLELPEAVRGRPLAVVHVGFYGVRHAHALESAGRRAWTEDNWLEVVRRLHASGHAVALTSGTRSERKLAVQLSADAGKHVAALPPLKVRELAALLERADLYVGVDSGPMHVASAVGTPMVVLFGPTDSRISGPWVDDPGRVRILQIELPCRPCKNHDIDCPENQCMQLIRPDDVLQAVADLLTRKPGTKLGGHSDRGRSGEREVVRSDRTHRAPAR
jgi:ADP-heptose:LPS heptosyltransferase